MSHSSRAVRDSVSRRLLLLCRGTADLPPSKIARDRLVELHLPLVRYLAARFAGRGEPVDDLIQVGTVGLLTAIDRFDPHDGAGFSAFAAPSIVGEIKRHLREHEHLVRVPPELQELQDTVWIAVGELSERLSRSPTVAELAAELDIPVDDIIGVIESMRAPIAVPNDEDDEAAPLTVADTLADEDEELLHVELRHALVPALSKLTERQRVLVTLRFIQSKTQSEIAAALGISQVQVSRLLSKTLDELRHNLPDVRSGR
jgi:RNA polymerase sigma-B factor